MTFVVLTWMGRNRHTLPTAFVSEKLCLRTKADWMITNLLQYTTKKNQRHALQCSLKRSLKGELSPNFTFWDESAWGWSTYWKVVTQIIQGLGKENPSKRRCKFALVSASALWCCQFRYDFCMLRTTSQTEIGLCMQGSREYCPVCVGTPELFVRFPTAVQYATKCWVTSRNTSTGLLHGNLPCFERRRVIHQKTFQE